MREWSNIRHWPVGGCACILIATVIGCADKQFDMKDFGRYSNRM